MTQPGYQLVLLGPDAQDADTGGLRKAFDDAVGILGLTPGTDTTILGARDFGLSGADATAAWDEDVLSVAVWADFGTSHQSSSEQKFLARLLADGVTGFPVVNRGERIGTLTPGELRAISRTG